MPVEAVSGLAKFKEIIARDEYAIFDFWAVWCGPCRTMSPLYEKLAESEEAKGIKFYKVDNDTEEEIVAEVGIRGLPTFAMYKNGQQVGSVLGARPPMLVELVKKATDALADQVAAAPAPEPTVSA